MFLLEKISFQCFFLIGGVERHHFCGSALQRCSEQVGKNFRAGSLGVTQTPHTMIFLV